jgi:hypothetical protein
LASTPTQNIFGAPAATFSPTPFGAASTGGFGGFSFLSSSAAGLSNRGPIQTAPSSIFNSPHSSQRTVVEDPISRVQDAMTSIADTIATLHVGT